MKRCANPSCRKLFEPKLRKQETCGANRCQAAVFRLRNPGYEQKRLARVEAERASRLSTDEWRDLLIEQGARARDGEVDPEVLAVFEAESEGRAFHGRRVGEAA